MTRRQKRSLARILIAAAMMLLFAFLPVEGPARFALYLLPYLTVGCDILRKAARGIVNRQVFDENFLMAVATLGALIIGLTRTGDYVEAVAVMLFYQIGELFQSIAVGRSRRSIAQLMDIRPDYANVEAEDGSLIQLSPDEIAVGTVIVVQPGERVALDGVVADGASTLNTGALTGESLPRDVGAGDEILSGCINLTGVLKIRTTRLFCDSTVARILDLVENASSRKSRSEQFISRFARYYTPAVCLGALALAVLPPLARMLLPGAPGNWSEWIYRALTFLVISCPCALVISIPLTFFAGLGGASKAGVLIKGSNYLETLARTSTVVFDKTGTLTRGDFEVTAVKPVGVSESALIEYAALAESASSHPISRSLIRAAAAPDRTRVKEIREQSGLGVTALVDGLPVACGNAQLMQSLGLSCPAPAHTGTIVHVALGGQYAGYIVISDQLKPTAAEAIRQLRRCGVQRTVMLTGDAQAVAHETASALGLDDYRSGLLPADKVDEVEALLAGRRKGEALIFVGDGVNDAPVLGRADVGVAMGALGSDAAIEAADVVLMDDDPLKIPQAVRMARRCMRIVYQNTVFAIGVKGLCLLLSALGLADMWLAIFADVGVMVLAVLNAIRALFVNKR